MPDAQGGKLAAAALLSRRWETVALWARHAQSPAPRGRKKAQIKLKGVAGTGALCDSWPHVLESRHRLIAIERWDGLVWVHGKQHRPYKGVDFIPRKPHLPAHTRHHIQQHYFSGMLRGDLISGGRQRVRGGWPTMVFCITDSSVSVSNCVTSLTPICGSRLAVTTSLMIRRRGFGGAPGGRAARPFPTTVSILATVGRGRRTQSRCCHSNPDAVGP